MSRLSYLVIGTTLAACAATNDYRYAPEHATVAIDGEPATRIAIPPERPEGQVKLASFGQTDLRTGDRDVTTLHVRMEVSNDGDVSPWVVDTRQQLLDVGNGQQLRPAFASSDANELPAVTVPPRGKRTIDLYYPMPGGHVSQFDVVWQVNTSTRPVAQRTAFQRYEQPQYDETPMYTTFWGPYWWYDPFWYPPTVVVHEPFFRNHHHVYRPGGYIGFRGHRHH